MDIKQVIEDVVGTHRAGRGRKPILPGARVVDRYKNGQPSTYEVEGTILTRRQYHILVGRLQNFGNLPPRKTTKPKGE